MMKNILFAFCIIIALIATSCKKDKADSATISELDISINQFIWDIMSTNYLWADNVPALNSSNYSSTIDIEEKLLKKYSDHKKFFDTLLYYKGSVDKYSFIIDDYEKFEASRQGYAKSMGFYYNLYLFNNYKNDDRLFGLVMYVVKGGPADKAGIKRGDFFFIIDDTQLTINNYQNLLSKESYKISLAYYHAYNKEITVTGTSCNLTAEALQENPIFLDTIYSINSRKIGYLIYNYFDPNFDSRLNAIFAKFKQEKISDLILDLRYNGGGAYSSAINLASMIYSTDNTKVFVKNEYNQKLQQKLLEKYGEGFFKACFTSKIIKGDAITEENINSLGLSKIYIITTQSTASTSEMLINNLMPYIKVYTFGNKTFGYGVGLMYFKDYDQLNRLNTRHKYAMQIVVLKTLNVNGNGFNTVGIEPYIAVDENYTSLLPLGDRNETLLNEVISNIFSSKSAKLNNPTIFDFYADKNDLIPHKKEIFMNTISFKK
ncbi:MAG TPA: S41 family peptidase [Bacteroidales bacterium]|nr:S41 family peptidase [Bacteroidales bacterium]